MNHDQGQLSILFNLKDSDEHHADLFENMGGVSHLACAISFAENSEKRFQAENNLNWMMKMKDMLQWWRLGQYGAERATVQWEALQIPNAECEHLTTVV
jgi:hypothetical protein